MEQENQQQQSQQESIEQFAADVVERIFEEGIPVDHLEIKFATDGMYLVTTTVRGHPASDERAIYRD